MAALSRFYIAVVYLNITVLWALRLCRSALRKGFAFPELALNFVPSRLRKRAVCHAERSEASAVFSGKQTNADPSLRSG